jgi:hypothetical protein
LAIFNAVKLSFRDKSAIAGSTPDGVIDAIPAAASNLVPA